MRIELKDISKRYTTQWVLKKLNFTFESGEFYGITGANGSGKSTLMKIVSTQLSPSLGSVSFCDETNAPIEISKIKDQITFSAPYILPLDNLSLKELFSFHTTFRKMKESIDYQEFLDLLAYNFKSTQLIKEYSSGMKQRISLALSILSVSDLILLDEPTSFLDLDGKKWYHNLLKEYRMKSTVIVSSNDESDHLECSSFLTL